MINARIGDGAGGKSRVRVSVDGELSTNVSTSPPLGPQMSRPYRHYLTADGTTGSNDMGVDGSVTNVDFWIPSHDEYDRYITSINILVGYGTTGQPNQWADGTALTNGSRLFYVSEKGEVDIHDGIKSNQDMFRLAFTHIPTAWEVRHVGASNDFGYILAMDLKLMGLPYGIKLDAGTTQRLILRVRDNAGAAADSFNMIGYGFERFS